MQLALLQFSNGSQKASTILMLVSPCFHREKQTIRICPSKSKNTITIISAFIVHFHTKLKVYPTLTESAWVTAGKRHNQAVNPIPSLSSPLKKTAQCPLQLLSYNLPASSKFRTNTINNEHNPLPRIQILKED